MILVTGANGFVGKEALHHLVRSVPASKIAAMVRTPEKSGELRDLGVEIRIADYDNSEALSRAMEGVQKLLLISGTDITNRVQQHSNVVDAAKEAGVQHIVYTSFVRNGYTEDSATAFITASHIATEEYIRNSGIPYTFMLNGLYAEVLPMFFGPAVQDTGIFLPAGEGKAAYTVRADIAEAAARILTGSGHEGKEYTITNTENHTMAQIADLLGDVLRRKISYTNPTVEEFRAAMSQAGLPEQAILMASGFGVSIAKEEFLSNHSDLPALIGRTPTTVRQFLQSTYANA